jgi:hypothetical protein
LEAGIDESSGFSKKLMFFAGSGAFVGGIDARF